MRKDVKLGFAIGGILLAVLVVYVLVISGNSSDKPEQVALVTETQAKGNKAPATAPAPASADSNRQQGRSRRQGNQQNSQMADAAKPAEQPATGAVAVKKPESAAGATDPFRTPTPSTKPSASDAVAANTPAHADDRWTTALQTGVPVLMTSTPSTATPAQTNNASPTSPAAPSADTAATNVTSNSPTPTIKPIMAVTSSNSPTASNSSATVTPVSAIPSSAMPLHVAPTTRSSGFSNNDSYSSRNTSNNESRTSAASVATPAADTRTHLVQNGETFSSIAAVVYGSAAYYPHLVRANPNIDPKKLKAGMTISIPPANEVRAETSNAIATTAAPSLSQSPAAAAKIDEKSEYRVESGDSLFKISSKLYGKIDHVEKIYDLNKAAIGPDKTKIKVGMVLKLPEAPTVKAQ